MELYNKLKEDRQKSLLYNASRVTVYNIAELLQGHGNKDRLHTALPSHCTPIAIETRIFTHAVD